SPYPWGGSPGGAGWPRPPQSDGDMGVFVPAPVPRDPRPSRGSAGSPPKRGDPFPGISHPDPAGQGRITSTSCQFRSAGPPLVGFRFGVVVRAGVAGLMAASAPMG